MNWQFYEFWGNFFTNVARGQKQFEELSSRMQNGFSGFSEIYKPFQDGNGLKRAETEDEQHSPTWMQAMDSFQQTLSQLVEQWGLVSQIEHQKVLDKCAELEKKVQEQQITIDKLRDLLDQEGMGHAELYRHFQDSLKEQSSQFNDLMGKISGTINNKS